MTRWHAMATLALYGASYLMMRVPGPFEASATAVAFVATIALLTGIALTRRAWTWAGPWTCLTSILSLAVPASNTPFSWGSAAVAALALLHAATVARHAIAIEAPPLTKGNRVIAFGLASLLPAGCLAALRLTPWRNVSELGAGVGVILVALVVASTLLACAAIGPTQEASL